MRSKLGTRIFAVLATTAVVAMAAGDAFAQSAPPPGQSCASGPGGKACGPAPSGGPAKPVTHQAQPRAPQPGQPGPQASRRQAPRAPFVGENARRFPPLQQARNSRLPPPPPGQHYRVMDDRVVRVDDSTLKVVAVVGLAAALLNAAGN